MDSTTLVVVVLFLLVFTLMIFGTIFFARKEKATKAQLAQVLGMTPVPEPDATLARKIFALYHTSWGTASYKLRNVSRRPLADGELFLLDLVDTSGDGDSTTENQAVVIHSPTLRLPPFQFYPKVDPQKYALGGLANKIVEWGVSKAGKPVSFPEYPAFAARYAVTSDDPPAVQRFFDEPMARYFAGTEYYTLHAADDLFVFSEIEPGLKTSDPVQMTRRVDRALEIYRLFQKDAPA